MNWPTQDRWELLLQSAGAGRSEPGWYHRLTKAYGEPQRYYHNHQHIAECLLEFDQARSLARDAATVEFALWFHDAVYDPKAGNNEEESAELARKCLRDCGIAPLIGQVTKFIMATKNHETGDDDDARLVVDVDLSILGRDQTRFLEYEEQIRREYAWVPISVFASKRVEILHRFLNRNPIFSTDWFRRKYEEQARKNLEHSISKLNEIASKELRNSADGR